MSRCQSEHDEFENMKPAIMKDEMVVVVVVVVVSLLMTQDRMGTSGVILLSKFECQDDIKSIKSVDVQTCQV